MQSARSLACNLTAGPHWAHRLVHWSRDICTEEHIRHCVGVGCVEDRNPILTGNGSGQLDLRSDGVAISAGAGQNGDVGETGSQCGDRFCVTKSSNCFDFNRDHVCGQSASMPRCESDHFAAMCVVGQKARCGAAGLEIGFGQCLHASHCQVHGRRIIADCARRACRRTSPAARADHRVYGYMLAVGSDCTSWAKVEAARTPDLFGA